MNIMNPKTKAQPAQYSHTLVLDCFKTCWIQCSMHFEAKNLVLSLIFLPVVDVQQRTCCHQLPHDSLFLPAEIVGHVVSHMVLIGFSIHCVFQNELLTSIKIPLYYIQWQCILSTWLHSQLGKKLIFTLWINE